MQSSLLTWLKRPTPAAPLPLEHLEHSQPEPKHLEHSHSQPEPEHLEHPHSQPEPTAEEDVPQESSHPPANQEEPPQEPSHPTLPTASQHPPSFNNPLLPKLPPNLTLHPCTSALLPAFKRLNALLLPIPYPPSFYTTILSDPTTSSLTLLALWHDHPSSSSSSPRVVAGIRCRLLHPDQDPPTGQVRTVEKNNDGTSKEKPTLYISTLATLSPYRSLGLATHLLAAVTATAITEYDILTVGAHVWVKNLEAREWYARRGFREVRVVRGYYRRLGGKRGGGGENGDGDAVVVERGVGVGDLLGRV